MDLKQLKERNRKSGKQYFSRLGVVNVDVGPKEHFPKLKDENGKTKLDADGKQMRSEKSDGWSYTFSEYGSAKRVIVVLTKPVKIAPLHVYLVSGFGYDLRQAGMIFLDQETKIEVNA